MLQFILPDARDLPGTAILAGLFGVVFVVAEVAWRRCHIHTEVTRKMVHAGGGVIVLLVPQLLTSVWSALALAMSFAVILGVARTQHWLPSVHAIKRASVGAALFPIAVAVCVIASRGELVRFEVPLLALALGDAAAALVGRRFGVVAYHVGGTRRTVEGSVAFAVVTAVVAVFFLVLGGVSVGVAIVLAVLVALVLMVVEALSIGGWDNLTIPLAGLVVVDIALATAALSGPVRNAVLLVEVTVVLTVVAVLAVTIVAAAARKALPAQAQTPGCVS